MSAPGSNGNIAVRPQPLHARHPPDFEWRAEPESDRVHSVEKTLEDLDPPLLAACGGALMLRAPAAAGGHLMPACGGTSPNLYQLKSLPAQVFINPSRYEPSLSEA
jgi:hypothetical protein